MKVFATIFLALAVRHSTAQKLNIDYQTATSSTERKHYLVFTDNSKCKLFFPATNHGDAMLGAHGVFNLTYKIFQDTITFYGDDLDTNNLIIKRLLRSKFIVTGRRKLYDVVSGYTYIDTKLVSDKYEIYVIDGKVYKQKKSKVDGYGIVRKSYRSSKKLAKRLQDMNADNSSIAILRGKEAYDKYGMMGMNGVIEITLNK